MACVKKLNGITKVEWHPWYDILSLAHTHTYTHSVLHDQILLFYVIAFDSRLTEVIMDDDSLSSINYVTNCSLPEADKAA
jgi:hypothetical protein